MLPRKPPIAGVCEEDGIHLLLRPKQQVHSLVVRGMIRGVGELANPQCLWMVVRLRGALEAVQGCGRLRKAVEGSCEEVR